MRSARSCFSKNSPRKSPLGRQARHARSGDEPAPGRRRQSFSAKAKKHGPRDNIEDGAIKKSQVGDGDNYEEIRY